MSELPKGTFTQEQFDAMHRRIQINDLREYWTALRHHDWHFNYSDDHQVWLKGNAKDGELRKWSEHSPEHKTLWDAFKLWSENPKSAVPPFPLRYLCDNARHMVCEPFSVENLHRMASALGIKRAWFHTGKFPHYDMPKKRVEELTAQCERMPQRTILAIIKAGTNGK